MEPAALAKTAQRVYRMPDGPLKHVAVFEAVYEGAFAPDLAEVEEVGYFTRAQIGEMIRSGEKFHPELLFLLDKETA